MNEFACIWNWLPDWELLESFWDEVELTAVGQGQNPTTLELAALWRLCPELREVPAGEVKARLQSAGEVEPGRFSSMQAPEFNRRAARLEVSFPIRAAARSFVRVRL